MATVPASEASCDSSTSAQEYPTSTEENEICDHCGKKVSSLKSCPRCGKVKYCCENCQEQHWHQHGMECKAESSTDHDNVEAHTSRKVSAKNDDVMEKACKFCGKRTPNLKCCTRCWNANYCDRECQKKHWKQHKLECQVDPKRTILGTNLQMPHLLLSVLWSEFARKDQGEREMELLLTDDTQDAEACQRLLKKRCNKHPGHLQFISVTELSMEHLPPPWRIPGIIDDLKEHIKQTVKIVVNFTSPHRPKCLGFTKLNGKNVSRVGSGWVHEIGIKNIMQTQPCPVKNCSFSSCPHRASGYFLIETAAHVIYDDSEAEKATVSFFYDDDKDKSSIIKAQGMKIHYMNLAGDKCVFFCVTHEFEKLHYKLTQSVIDLSTTDSAWLSAANTPLGFVIAHPHGCCKTITFGELKDIQTLKERSAKEVEERLGITGDTRFMPTIQKEYDAMVKYDIPTCPGSSGAPVIAIQIVDGGVKTVLAPHSRHVGKHVNKSGTGTLTAC